MKMRVIGLIPALLSQGGAFSLAFDKVGEFVYHCAFHPATMRNAMILVTK